MVHLVAYDLISPHGTSDDYQRVIAGLKSAYPRWCHLEKSVWIITVDQDAAQVRDHVKTLLFPTDRLFVGRLSGNWGGFNMGPDRANWLKQQTF